MARTVIAGTNASGNKAASVDDSGNLNTSQQILTGTTSEQVRGASTLKTAHSTAVAIAGSQALWTPAAGKRFRLRTLSGRASVAGLHEVRDGATVISYVYLGVNVWTAILDIPANGYLSATANNVLSLYNGSGVLTDMTFTASGNEE